MTVAVTADIADLAAGVEHQASHVFSLDLPSGLPGDFSNWQDEVRTALAEERIARESAIIEISQKLTMVEDLVIRQPVAALPERKHFSTGSECLDSNSWGCHDGVSTDDDRYDVGCLKHELETLRMQQKAEICTLAELLGAEQQLVMARISISELDLEELRKDFKAQSATHTDILTKVDEAGAHTTACIQGVTALQRHIENLERQAMQYREEMGSSFTSFARSVASKDRVEAFRQELQERFDEHLGLIDDLRDQVEQLACMEPSAGRPPQRPVTLGSGLRPPSTGSAGGQSPTTLTRLTSAPPTVPTDHAAPFPYSTPRPKHQLAERSWNSRDSVPERKNDACRQS
mmetsp:Transcript_15454/g.35302  ORF Transcript_15454/g.35302 Transcript_15454/m.35302 type:complete len:346 (-) Transcript_15454:43-1080(-)